MSTAFFILIDWKQNEATSRTSKAWEEDFELPDEHLNFLIWAKIYASASDKKYSFPFESLEN